jgi:hypothetical protein
MDTPPKNRPPAQSVVEVQIRKKSLIAFSVFFVCIGAAIAGWMWLYHQPATDSGVQHTLRQGLSLNEKVFSLLYSRKRTTKAYKKPDAAEDVRVNGNVGMDGALDTTTWRLKIAKADGDTLVLTLDDLKALPKTEIVFDFKCVEGWNQITYWGGVRFSDVLEKYNLVTETGMKYTGMITPDESYYVGVDMPSMLNPQTLLCYEMNGKTLPQNQGYPLRLIIPVKYGIKHLKRIGTIYFSNEKPADYCAERGYDYYAGL